jgi:hypothetical protein
VQVNGSHLTPRGPSKNSMKGEVPCRDCPRLRRMNYTENGSSPLRIHPAALDWRISLVARNKQCWLRLSFLHQRAPRRNILFKNWIKITGHAAMLGFETQQVMHLRMMKLFAGGPEAQSEALRMVTEKTSALTEATMTLARGGSAQRVIRRYRTHVRSNHRRLSKP